LIIHRRKIGKRGGGTRGEDQQLRGPTLPNTNARPSSKTSPTDSGELVYLLSRLVDGEDLAANHVQSHGRCLTCREVWPCIGGAIADQVIRLQQRRSG
jgi:hypothetical protein